MLQPRVLIRRPSRGPAPVGISFDDAEAILRAAGCSILLLKQGYVSARSNLPRGMLDFYAHEFAVELAPRGPGEFSGVGAVRASIFIKYRPNADRR